MNRKEKAKLIAKILDETIPHPKIPLDHKDAYTLLIAVLLSARCTDARVNEVTPTLFKRASTPAKMVKLKVSEIQKIIKPCGLSPAKSKAIHGLSEILIDKYHSKVPNTFEDLESLPGVGHKTASVVMAQAFKKPVFPVDTHIFRVAKRWGLSSGTSVKQTEKDLKALFPESTWDKVHLQMILFGRKYCPALRHDKKTCPICSVIT